MQYILPNKLLWYIAIANVFVYLLRYGILDWSPTYLKEVKHFALDKSSWAYFLYEYAGIPGTLLCGWMSDKVFKGNRGATGVFFYDPGDHRHCRLLAEPAGQSGRRYGLYDHHWLPDLRPGDADWSMHALELAPKKPPGPPRASPACSAILAVPWPRALSSATPSISSAGTAALW